MNVVTLDLSQNLITEIENLDVRATSLVKGILVS